MKLQQVHDLTPETRGEVRAIAAAARNVTLGLVVLGLCVLAAALIHKHVTVSHLKGA